MAAKGKKSGESIAKTWALLFAQNETDFNKFSKGDKKAKPLTDSQLVEHMQSEFPDNAEKTTITRIPRGIYNKGTNMFKKEGASGVKGRPTSYKYDEEGNRVERGKRSAKKADDGKKAKASEKKKPAAKAKKADAKKTETSGKKRRRRKPAAAKA